MTIARAQVEANLDELNRTLEAYALATRKAPEEVLARQSRNLGFYLRDELKKLIPKKGSIRAQGLARLDSGEGVRVRPSVALAVASKYRARTDLASRQVRIGKSKKGKLSVLSKEGPRNLRALMVRAELNVRERGRGFLRQSARFSRRLEAIGDEAHSESRFDQILGVGTLRRIQGGAELSLAWGGTGPLSAAAARGLSRKGELALQIALRRTTDDVLGYLERRLARRAIRSQSPP